MSPQARLLSTAGLALAILYPFLVPNYLVTVGMLILFTAFLGQSWNLSGGFAGQTSFGHVVFFGTGAYCSAILQVTYGWNPWLAWPVSTLAGAAVGWMIATLSFRYLESPLLKLKSRFGHGEEQKITRPVQHIAS